MTVRFASQTRERFLIAVARDIPIAHIREVHLFQPIRQGGVESGVAVVAADEVLSEPPSPDTSVASAIARPPELGAPATSDAGSSSPAVDPALERFTVYMARYRLTLKGPDRGKWETEVVAEAEAPLLTVDAVVRGVQRRSGDMEDAERMSGDEVRMVVGGALGSQ
jgi:hypothetical protein